MTDEQGASIKIKCYELALQSFPSINSLVGMVNAPEIVYDDIMEKAKEIYEWVTAN